MDRHHTHGLLSVVIALKRWHTHHCYLLSGFFARGIDAQQQRQLIGSLVTALEGKINQENICINY